MDVQKLIDHAFLSTERKKIPVHISGHQFQSFVLNFELVSSGLLSTESAKVFSKPLIIGNFVYNPMLD